MISSCYIRLTPHWTCTILERANVAGTPRLHVSVALYQRVACVQRESRAYVEFLKWNGKRPLSAAHAQAIAHPMWGQPNCLGKFNRDEEERIVNELRSLRKSFSDDMLHQKCERSRFRAKPVPIESRIPLYDKILEDQAMRFIHSTRTPRMLFTLFFVPVSYFYFHL